jgi:hypothetical protein
MILMGINDDVDNCPEFYNPNQEDKTTMVLVISVLRKNKLR